MNNCAIIPRVKNKKGEITSSKLFIDLLEFTNNDRARTIEIYGITKNPDFIFDFKDKLKFDDNNEPTIGSLIKYAGLSKYIPEREVLDNLNKKIGHYMKGDKSLHLVPFTKDNYDKLVDKAIEFNTNTDYNAIAKINKIYKDGKQYLNIEVVSKTRETSKEAADMEYNKRLDDLLISKLGTWGISVGALSDLEERLGINGVTDFNLAKTAAEGLVELIRIAKGEEGIKALPEEFAHFVVEALGDNPLITRLVNAFAKDEAALKEILGNEYDTYNTKYKESKSKLAKEAIGKLLAKHIINNKPIEAKAKNKSLLSRLVSYVKQFFSRLSGKEIVDTINLADKHLSSLARDILVGKLDNKIKLSNITTTEKFYNLNEMVERDEKLLNRIIDVEIKRYKIYSKRSPNSKFDAKQQQLLTDLEESLKRHDALQGIYTFLESASDTMKSLDKRLRAVTNDETVGINEKAKVLRDIKNYVASYGTLATEITKVIRKNRTKDTDRYEDKALEHLGALKEHISAINDDFFEIAIPLFVDFLKIYAGDSLTIPWGKHKGEKIDINELLTKARKDISFFDTWLTAMADNSDTILRLFDNVVVTSKEEARLNTIEVRRELEAALMNLESAGFKNTDFMFERDEHGVLTGKYISDIDYKKYAKDYTESLKELASRYMNSSGIFDQNGYNEAVKKWMNEHNDVVDGKYVPKMSIYGTKEFRALKQAQKDYYYKIMNIKSRLDNLLPLNYTETRNIIFIRKDLLERVKGSKSIKGGVKEWWESLKDEVIKRSDDIDFGNKATLIDFEGRKVDTLPIYYTRYNGDMNAISTDVTSTLLAYAAMANDYHQMGKVINVLELGRDIVRQQKVLQTSGNRILKEGFKGFGREIEQELTIPGESSKRMQRLNYYFDMQVYGRYIADEGTIGNSKYDKAKVIDKINELTALNTYALNLLSGISNVETGKVMMRIESIGARFFSESNTLKADKIYGENMPGFLAQLGDRVKTNKLALWNELFNVKQDYESDVQHANYDRRTWASRGLGLDSLYFMNNIGEHWMQTRTSLALGDAYKMKDKSGNIVSLWEAMEVKYTDPKNPKKGASLVVKEGYTKADGSEFTKQDIIKFTRRCKAINQKMHGIYNKLDRAALQNLGIGRMAFMYRKWMVPSYIRRFGKLKYDYNVDDFMEGYYSTTGRFLYSLYEDLRHAEFHLIANYKKLDKREQANIRSAVTEVSHFLAITALLGMIDWPDDEEESWLTNMTEYQLRRLANEIGVLTPTPLMARELLRILKSPAAGVNTIEDCLDTLGILNPWNYEIIGGEDAVLQSGRFKGHDRAYKYFFESPLFPMNKTIYKALHPEEAISFYK